MLEETGMRSLRKGARIVGPSRSDLARKLRLQYESGASIRDLAALTGRSYGFVHGVLKDADTTLRQRGGAVTRRHG